MTPLRFLTPADREMCAAARYYESRSRNLGRRFLHEVQQTLDAIVEHPYAGGVLRTETRRRLVHRFLFAVIYRIEPDEILVLAIADLRRNPEYWVDRL